MIGSYGVHEAILVQALRISMHATATPVYTSEPSLRVFLDAQLIAPLRTQISVCIGPTQHPPPRLSTDQLRLQPLRRPAPAGPTRLCPSHEGDSLLLSTVQA